MTMMKWISVLAAASLATAPAAAQPVRTAAPIEEAESAAGGNAFAWVMAAVMVIGVILILTDDDDEFPESP
jgi:hypothetical protein